MRILRVELLWVRAGIAELVADPHPGGACVEDEVELFLLRANVNLGENLNVEVIIQILLDILLSFRPH